MKKERNGFRFVSGKEGTYYKSYYNLKLEKGIFKKEFIKTDFEDILKIV